MVDLQEDLSVPRDSRDPHLSLCCLGPGPGGLPQPVRRGMGLTRSYLLAEPSSLPPERKPPAQATLSSPTSGPELAHL